MTEPLDLESIKERLASARAAALVLDPESGTMKALEAYETVVASFDDTAALLAEVERLRFELGELHKQPAVRAILQLR